jgi:hypothetical protein
MLTKHYNAIIELKVLDEKGHERGITISFNQQDGWNDIDEQNTMDIMGFMAGGIMQVVARDKTVIGYEATAFKERNGELVKAVSFTPYIKHEGVFKSALVGKDGTVEFL